MKPMTTIAFLGLGNMGDRWPPTGESRAHGARIRSGTAAVEAAEANGIKVFRPPSSPWWVPRW